MLTELERYGLITGRPMGRDTLYDEEALVVARLAAGFLRFGVEARHLRMYKVAAEREASFFEQVVPPAREAAQPRRAASGGRAISAELAELGESLRGGDAAPSVEGTRCRSRRPATSLGAGNGRVR